MPAFYIGVFILAVLSAVLGYRRRDIPGMDIVVALVVVVCAFALMLIITSLCVLAAANAAQING